MVEIIITIDGIKFEEEKKNKLFHFHCSPVICYCYRRSRPYISQSYWFFLYYRRDFFGGKTRTLCVFFISSQKIIYKPPSGPPRDPPPRDAVR